LATQFRDAIHAIYGFVRFADEIVDSFHAFDKRALLDAFVNDTYRAISARISTNPILHSFQLVVNRYNIGSDLIDAFLKSMEMDLYRTGYDGRGIGEYIYGSAEVVGLMCLKVFCNGDLAQYERLREPASKLGAAFQKVNFLRDIRADYYELGRVYFPGIDFTHFSREQKIEIEKGIQDDFDQAFTGILQLNRGARFGVYLAYRYYLKLFERIRRVAPSELLSHRYRISNFTKLRLLVVCYLRHRAGWY
jgi:phytoene/squalene synthetase